MSSQSSNCSSLRNKKIRNKKYYEDNKENLKSSKVRFHLNIEVRKEKEDWLNEIKTKIVFVKEEFEFEFERQDYTSSQCSLHRRSSR